jgi:hypothetical protein
VKLLPDLITERQQEFHRETVNREYGFAIISPIGLNFYTKKIQANFSKACKYHKPNFGAAFFAGNQLRKTNVTVPPSVRKTESSPTEPIKS